jgi:hypothetical protein
MAANKDRKGGGSKLTRTQTVTVRLDPKLRYLAELAARKHRRTLSSFIEWAIEESLSNVLLTEPSAKHKSGVGVAAMAEILWDVDEADRFAKLAFNCRELLNHEEQVLWKLAREQAFLWEDGEAPGVRKWFKDSSCFLFKVFRASWPDLNAVVQGKLEASELSRRHSDRVSKSIRDDLDSRAKRSAEIKRRG